MKTIRLSLVSLLVLFLAACAGLRPSANESHPVDPRWAAIDSLGKIGQYATAVERIEVLRTEAATSGDWRTEFRTWEQGSSYQSMINVEIDTIINAIDRRAQTAPVPLAQLLRSLLMGLWWERYSDERWEIMARTELDTAFNATDPEMWTQGRYMERILREAQASLEPHDTLMQIPIGELHDLLDGDTATHHLRPTLYDVLAHRAIELFSNPETRIAEPAWQFKVDGPEWFDLFEPFALRKLEHRDSTAFDFQAMCCYQRLERLHLNDDKLDAYVDVALQRLAYVYRHSPLPEKDSLYLASMELLRSRLPDDACEAEVMVAIAEWHTRQADQYDRLAVDAWKWERKTAGDLCDSAVAKWPGSFGARNALALKARLERPFLSVQAEAANAQGPGFLIALEYTNTKQVWLRVVKDPVEMNKREGDLDLTLFPPKIVREWSVQLPDDGDLNRHLVELPVEGLPFGHYVLRVSNGEDFVEGTDMISYTNFWVTNLAFADRSEGTDLDLLVLDRTSGAPKQRVKVTAFVRNPDYSGVERYLGLAEFETDAEGMVRTNLKGPRGEMRWEIKDGDDVYLANGKWIYTHAESEPDSLRTFLFTDRAIYRPGQEVFVKGIATVKRGKSTLAKEGHIGTLYFRDANSEVVDSLRYRTDAFGAFIARFEIPLGRLTGQWELTTEQGYRGLRVEEYKRPTFEAVFDPIATMPKLGEQATVTGIAKSYAGAPLDGALVRYTVKRGANMPWWCGWGWRGLPWGRETEVASGEVLCDAQGKFSVTFKAEADRAFPRNADPSFSFTVEAWVTDINGETQVANTSFVVGYRSIDLDIDLGESLDRTKADSLHVRVANLNGHPVEIPVDVRISRIKPEVVIQPDGTVNQALALRDRLWERPDRFVLTEAEHDSLFPGQVYANENDPTTWPVADDGILKHSGPVFGKPIALRGVRDWEVGTYRVEVRAVDPSGREVKVQRVFTLFDPEIQNTGFENEPFHVEAVNASCEPGQKAVLLLSTALPACRVLMEVERDGQIVVSRPFALRKGQQRVELPVLEGDRGGFAVHFVCVERGRSHNRMQWIDVPWSNKELKAEWMSFRDKLLPGAKEEWRLKITGPKKEKVVAQLLATMYDASLDVFEVPSWWMDVWHPISPRMHWERCEPIGAEGSRSVHMSYTGLRDSTRSYPGLVGLEQLGGWMNRKRRFRTTASPAFDGDAHGLERSEVFYYEVVGGNMADAAGAISELEVEKNGEAADPSSADNGQRATNNGSPLRTDFRETAFFFPDLLTDRDGNVVLRFTMPDALTRWNFMGLAHTKEMQTAHIALSTVTQKPLMVMPNLPRFLRSGDRITLTAKVNVMEGGPVNGTALLEVFDPRTNKPITGLFKMSKPSRTFTAAPGQSAIVSWALEVPEGVDAVAVRITASSPAASDGEERVLPVLTDRMLLTESLPLSVMKAGKKTFELANLIGSGASSTLQHRSLTLEFTPNPAWYAVQALPYLMEFPHECAEQVFSRYYANHLATLIVGQRPNIKKVFDAWSKGTPGNEGAFLSALEKNPELKSVLLEETPWVMNAKDEGERKRRLALFFDLHRMASEDATALKKLQDMQLPNGAWPWWSGMQPSRYITQHLVAGFGHLQQLGAFDLDPDSDAQRMIAHAVDWLDTEAEEAHERMVRDQANDSLPLPSSEDIHYLYARSSLPQHKLKRGRFSAGGYIASRARQSWMHYGMQEQAMIAIALRRFGMEEVPQLITNSLAQRATMNEELGMYWKDFQSGFAWNELPTETHALMIEAFEIVTHDKTKVDALRQYLLKLKQTTDWRTTKATADACYALLLTGADWLEPRDAPVITVGASEVKAGVLEAGTGYFQSTWDGAEVKPAMGRVSVTTASSGVQWGALHWQYFEQMDKVKPAESPFSIRREVMLNEQTDAGPRLVALSDARVLKPGDKVTVRVELRTDRYLDYVHLKDLRAAGLEPVEALSGYRWKGGLGYYQSIRDAAMHFFFDRIAPGTYVFEYDLKVTHAGEFSNGVARAQCMYAPEFSSHSEGLRIVIGD